MVVAAMVVSAPIGIALFFSVASRPEDKAGTLGGTAPGPLQAAARRMVGFHAEISDWPQSKASAAAAAAKLRLGSYQEPAQIENSQPVVAASPGEATHEHV
jgi:hypothetical protein